MNSQVNAAIEKSTESSKLLDSDIIESLERLASLSRSFGHPVKPYTKKSLVDLQSLDLTKKEALLKKIQTIIQIVVAANEIEPTAPSTSYPERHLLEVALQFYGLKLKDEEFWNTITHDEVIEIYNPENIQIFRSFSFFETSSYSLFDLLAYEWFNLWERPKGTFDNMFKVVESIFSGKIKGPTSACVPEHVIKEIFDSEDQKDFIPRSSLCKFGVICPVYNISDGQIGGLLVSAKVTPVVLGDESKNITCI